MSETHLEKCVDRMQRDHGFEFADLVLAALEPTDTLTYQRPNLMVMPSAPHEWHPSQKVLALPRYWVAWKLGRPLKRGEMVRFVNGNRVMAPDNFMLKSQEASARELYTINGGPILGYTHCLCGCGETLDVERQRTDPYAYATGHSPADHTRRKITTAAMNGAVTKPEPPDTMQPAFTPTQAPNVHLPAPEPLAEYRPIMEAYIHSLPWDRFRLLLPILKQLSHD